MHPQEEALLERLVTRLAVEVRNSGCLVFHQKKGWDDVENEGLKHYF